MRFRLPDKAQQLLVYDSDQSVAGLSIHCVYQDGDPRLLHEVCGDFLQFY